MKAASGSSARVFAQPSSVRASCALQSGSITVSRKRAEKKEEKATPRKRGVDTWSTSMASPRRRPCGRRCPAATRCIWFLEIPCGDVHFPLGCSLSWHRDRGRLWIQLGRRFRIRNAAPRMGKGASTVLFFFILFFECRELVWPKCCAERELLPESRTRRLA